jgi:hypothetical protein
MAGGPNRCRPSSLRRQAKLRIAGNVCISVRSAKQGGKDRAEVCLILPGHLVVRENDLPGFDRFRFQPSPQGREAQAADYVEAHRPGVDGVPVPRLLGELDPVVGENRVDLEGYGLREKRQSMQA